MRVGRALVDGKFRLILGPSFSEVALREKSTGPNDVASDCESPSIPPSLQTFQALFFD